VRRLADGELAATPRTHDAQREGASRAEPSKLIVLSLDKLLALTE
jgi:hypothetical protein